jgi:hypothetical protein
VEGTGGGGGEGGGRRMNTMLKIPTQARNCNNDPCCNYFINWGRGIKGSGGGGEFKYDIVATSYESL